MTISPQALVSLKAEAPKGTHLIEVRRRLCVCVCVFVFNEGVFDVLNPEHLHWKSHEVTRLLALNIFFFISNKFIDIKKGSTLVQGVKQSRTKITRI